MSNKDNNSDELKSILHILESKTFKFIFIFICIGVFLIFFTSIFNISENKYYEVANAVNMFISIVVGIVAMVMSIISLFFSFYNTKQSYDTHDDYLEKFININNSLEQTLERQKEYIERFNQLSNKLEKVDEKISYKLDKVYDRIDSLGVAHFNELEPKIPRWGRLDEADWDEIDESDTEDLFTKK